MNLNIPLVNIFNIVRMSHESPSKFYIDDLDTFEKQLIIVKYFNLPATFALKYDALMNEEYRNIIKKYKSDNIEFACWLEVTEHMLDLRENRSHHNNEEYDDRIDSLYIIGYTPRERKKILDKYMESFKEFFGYYPKTIGSWILDEVTISYAIQKYDVVSCAICRDQMDTDGFSYFGGYNGLYYPSKNNLYLPANYKENQLNITCFRLLSPDPIYSFEQNVRDDLFGVYTMEPASITGRGKIIDWYFENIINEKNTGINYLQIGQENNFLWPNISSGYLNQIKKIFELSNQGKIQVYTMEKSGQLFIENNRQTPIFSQFIENDWKDDLKTFWINTNFYRLSILEEKNKVRIRDLFIYKDEYRSEYLDKKFDGKKSEIFALPILFPQKDLKKYGKRPFIKILDQSDNEIEGKIDVQNHEDFVEINISDICKLHLFREKIEIIGDVKLKFDYLPSRIIDKYIHLNFSDFDYKFEVSLGKIKNIDESIIINNSDKTICLYFGKSDYEDNKKSFFMNQKFEINEKYINLYNQIVDEINLNRASNLNSKNLIIPNKIDIKNIIDRRDSFNDDKYKLFDYSKVGSLDYIDGNWTGTKENYNIDIKLDEKKYIKYIDLGFLFNHRQGIIYPKKIEISINDNVFIKDMTDLRPEREIAKENFRLNIGLEADEITIKTINYDYMPRWAFYYGAKDVFNLLDRIYIVS